MDPLLILALLRLSMSLGGFVLIFLMLADRDSQTFPLWMRWLLGLVGFALVVTNGFAEVLGFRLI